jgi:CelD/BcsL family acetyltransferase involved in cellulose biosynthesis
MLAPPAHGPSLSTELIAGHRVSGDVAVEWDALADTAGTPNIFHERWMVAPMAALPEAAGLTLLLVRDGATLIGLLPLQPRRVRGLTVATQVWEQRVRALGEPLVLPGRERDFWTAALAALDRRRGGLWLRLAGLDADSPSTRALYDLRPCLETRRYERAALRSDLDAEAYRRAHTRAKVLKEHRRLRNRLADRGAVAIEALAPDADPDPWIDDLFRLELGGWKGRARVAAASDPASARCHRAILTAAHARGRLDLRRLALDSRAIAMLATIEAPGGHGFQLKTSYDEDYAAFSPGVLLEMAYLDHALDVARLVQVDSCARAGHPMIDRIWAERRTIVSLAVPYARASSRLALALLRRRRG